MDTKTLATWQQLTGHETIRAQVELASQGKLPDHRPYLLEMTLGAYRERLADTLASWHSGLRLTDEAIMGPADLNMEIDMDFHEIKNIVDEVDLEDLIDKVARADEAVRDGMNFLDSRYRTHVERFDRDNLDIEDCDRCILAQATDMTWGDAVVSLGLERWTSSTNDTMIGYGFVPEDGMSEILTQLWIRAYEARVRR